MSQATSYSVVQSSAHQVPALPLPAPRVSALSIRVASKDDLPFIDALQKMHSHMVGFLRWGEIEKHIENGIVLVAEETPASGIGDPIPVGYVMARDTYKSREEVGIIYQLNVLPLRQKHLVGATLVKAAFEKAAYGCRLFCLWCAQDIQANWFWESIGFIPLAFRTGSRAKQRIQIFWQRRIRDNDDFTPYWFPSKTDKGAVGEDRIVLPIPPDTHWRDAKPVLLPGLPAIPQELPKALPGGALVRPRPEQPRVTKAHAAAIARSKSKVLGSTAGGKAAVITSGGVRYIDRADSALFQEVEPPKQKRPRAPRQKNDPKYEAAARELRDRYLEQVNCDRLLPSANGKYDVSRQLTDSNAGTEARATRLLLKAA